MKRYSAVIIFLSSISYLLIFQNYGLNLWDEGVFLNGALRTMEGESVYVNFNGYPPGRYILGAALFEIFGIDIPVIRTAVTIMTAIAAVMLYSISLRLIPSPFLAFIPPVLFLASPAVYYNRLYPIFTIFGIYAIFWYLQKEHPYRAIFLSISAVISMYFKLEIGIGIAIISMTMLLLKKRLKEFAYFLFTFGLAIIFILLSYTIRIDIYSLLSDIYSHIFKIADSWGNPFPNLLSPELWKRANIYEIFSTLLFYIPPIIYSLTFFILLRTANPELRNQIAITLFFGIYTYNLVIWRAGFDNLIRCLPPAWILGGYLLYLFRIKLLKWPGERILSYAIILLLPLWFLYMMFFYGDFYSGSIGEMRKPHVHLSLERANNIHIDPVEASWIKEITEHIKNNTSSDDTIFTVPLNPIWHFLTDRKNPTYYEWILPGELKTEAEQGKVIGQLKKKLPSFIIYADIAIDNIEERRFSSYAPLIYGFIIENYRLEKTVGFFQIWRHGK